MAFLQFLSGARDQEFEQLNDAASLVLGSGAEAHIRCPDAGIEPKHCTIYPAQGAFWLQDVGTGSTVFNMKRMASTTQGLKQGDVFIVGGTYVKFWAEKPAGGAGGGGGGADPAALEAAQQELAAAKTELERLQAGAGEAEQVRTQLQETTQELETTRQELEATTQKAEEAAQRASQLEADLAAAKTEAEAQASEAQETARKERVELEEALEATRTALEALRSEAEASGADSLQAALAPSDLSAALDALALPDPLRRRLESAVASEIDREVLRRSEGPVVPLRGLKIPGSNRDFEAEIRAIRQRGEQVEAARKLGLADLSGEDLERLMELARN